MTVLYQVAPRYTAGSPAQVDLATAEHVKRIELRAYDDLIDAGGADRDRALALGLAGIVEVLTEWPDGSRTVQDAITGTSRTRHPVREVQTPDAIALADDLRTVRALVSRRGATWLATWATMYRGVEPGGTTVDLTFAEYATKFPNCPDPRD